MRLITSGKGLIRGSLSFGLVSAVILSLCIMFSYRTSSAAECQSSMAAHPEWIFCDDFEDGTALVRTGRYSEHANNNGDFVLADNVGLNGSKGMKATWHTGEIEPGHLILGFGRNPDPYMDKGIRNTTDFREIYYRAYLKMQAGWQGAQANLKFSRATVIAKPDWSQAMAAHFWGDQQYRLLIDPVRCVGGSDNKTIICKGWNDIGNMVWLGSQSGTKSIFDSQHSDTWYCIESHVKLNDPGQANGIQEFWIDGALETSKTGVDFVKAYSAYGINSVWFETYWGGNAPKTQERYLDNIVVSTQRIGCINNTTISPPRNLRIVR